MKKYICLYLLFIAALFPGLAVSEEAKKESDWHNVPLIKKQKKSKKIFNSEHFNKKCHFSKNIKDLKKLQRCEKYIFLNLSKMTKQERKKKSAKITGLGFDKPYILIVNPFNAKNTVISVFSKFNKKRISALLDKNIQRKEKKTTISDQAFFSTIVQVIIPLDKTVNYSNEEATLEYQIDYFTQKPFYDTNQADNKKYIRVTNLEPAGIDFYTAQGSTYKSWSEHMNSQKYYVYRDYLNSVKTDVSIDNLNATRHEVHPKNSDRDETSFTKTSNFGIDFGFKSVRTPLETISASASSTIEYNSGNFFDFNVIEGEHKVSYKYFITKYSINDKKYCDFLREKGDCWYRTSGSMQNPYDLTKLNETPYQSGFFPPLTVTYSVPYTNTGKSILSINTVIEGIVLLADSHLIIGNWYANGENGKRFSPDEDKRPYDINTYRDLLDITIDWSSPRFHGAQPVRINSLFESDVNSKCLDVHEETRNVFLAECDKNSITQLFYYTPNSQYISAVDFTSCLTTENSSLTLARNCVNSPSSHKKWGWNSLETPMAVLFTETEQGFNVLDPNSNGFINIVNLQSLDKASNKNKFNEDISYLQK